jgi:DNA topoisomerase I
LCNDAVAGVARALRNTPAVCRKAYIDPVVFDLFASGELGRVAAGVRGRVQWERAALRLLRGAHRAARASSTRNRRKR